MPLPRGVGSDFNPILAASGKHILLEHARAVTFVSRLSAGTQTLTFKESIAGSGEQALTAIDHVHYGLDTGTGFVLDEQTAADTYVNSAGASGPTVVVTIRADQLSDTFTAVECTASAGDLTAIIHDLVRKEDPTLLPIPSA